MPFYKLVASGRPDVIADEIILARDPQTGEVTKSINSRIAEELTDEEVAIARGAANTLGYRVLELEEDPDEEMQARAKAAVASQTPGADAVVQSPIVTATGDSGAEIDQQETQAADEQAQGAKPQTGTSSPPNAANTQGTPAPAGNQTTTPERG